MTQLWPDERIRSEAPLAPFWGNDFKFAIRVRDDYEKAIRHLVTEQASDLRRYEQRIADLEAEVERLRAEQWTPVTDGEYACPCADCQDPMSSGWLLYATTEQIGIVCADDEDNDRYVELPPNLRLCQRGDA